MDTANTTMLDISDMQNSQFCGLILFPLPQQVYDGKRKRLHCSDIHCLIPTQDIRNKQNIQLW